MRPLHICFLSQEYPPDTGWGGIGSYTYEMAHGLVQAGQRVTVITRAVDREQVLDDAGVAVHRVLPAPDWSRVRGLWRLNRIWPGFAWAAMLRLRSVHAQTRVDLVEAAEDRADSFFVPWLRRRPRLIVRLHTAWIFVDRLNEIVPDRKKRFIYWQERQAILGADGLTAPSQAVVDLTRSWLSLRQRDVAVVPNPINTLTFAPTMEHRGADILFAGRLERRKGVATLSQMLACVLRRAPAASFRFVGSDGMDSDGRSWRERLLEQVPAAEQQRVHFEHIPRDTLIQRYRQAALCVVPSVWENFPYTLLEAMACATPIIATRAGGMPELVEDGVSGLLVPPESPVQLADALCALLDDAPRRVELGRNARRRVEEQCSVSRVVPRMLAAYTAVLNGC